MPLDAPLLRDYSIKIQAQKQDKTVYSMNHSANTETTPQRVLIVIPAYNEESSILNVVSTIQQYGYDYIVINDGSTDKTLDICLAHGINVLDLPRNLGIGGAVQAGHKYALRNGYDIDIQVDSDGQHDISYIPHLVDRIHDGADLVIGSRFIKPTKGSQSTFMRRMGIRWLSLMIRSLYKKKVSDPTSGFRACGRKALELFSKTYSIDYPEPESIAEALNHGLSIAEVPVNMNERQGGVSSIKAFSSIYYMIKVSLAILFCSIEKRH